MIVLLLNLAFSIFIIVIVILTWINTNKIVDNTTKNSFENFGRDCGCGGTGCADGAEERCKCPSDCPSCASGKCSATRTFRSRRK